MKFLQMLEAIASKPKVYKVTKTKQRDGRTYDTTGTLAELIDVFSYTLETGAEYAHEKGNKKINRNPTTIASLVTNLNNAVNNAAANGYAGVSFAAVETTAQGKSVKEDTVNQSVMTPAMIKKGMIKEDAQLDEKVFDNDQYDWYVWHQKKPSKMFERRGGAKQIEQGMTFGLRPATSKPGTWRLILKAKGPSIIFSIDSTDANALVKAATKLKD